MRRLALIALVLVAAATIAAVASASGPGGAGGNYRVRAIFDDASFAVAGEQVRVAGAPVGSIASLDVTKGKQAAVTLQINDAQFTPFHANATCAIRPQSLIGEMYVDCAPGTSAAPELHRIRTAPARAPTTCLSPGPARRSTSTSCRTSTASRSPSGWRSS